jgi:hypothetical protein
MGYIMTTTHSGKHQARPPTYHFEGLLEEACPNHVYPIKHKLKVYDMMQNFMTSRSLTRVRELEENLGGSDTMPFPREDVVMMMYDGRPPPGRHRVSILNLKNPACCDWGPRNTGV